LFPALGRAAGHGSRAARIGLAPLMVSGGHQSMLTRPDEVAAALLKC
jgi:hypothetical protein